MIDLSTTWLGLPLAHPVMASANPLTGTVESLKRLQDAGVSAATLPSLFEEQVEHEAEQLVALVDYGAESFGEAPSGYLPPLPEADTGGRYLRLVEEAKQGVDIPIVASLNGVSEGGWTRYAKRIEEAGADGLELNVYFIATNPHETSAQVEERYLALVHEVRAAIEIPLAVKIGPFFSSIPNMVKKLAEAGANGVAIFNRFYQPDIDLEELDVVPDIQLSTSAAVRLPLRWTAILRGRVDIEIGVTSGVHTWQDVAKCLLAGADTTMMAAALLKTGGDVVEDVLSGLRAWMGEQGYSSVRQLKGSMSQENVARPAAFERANYMQALQTFAAPLP